jgi:hypothetical protein
MFRTFGGLDGIARAIDREVRDGPQRRELLDRLMRGAVFAEAGRSEMRFLGHVPFPQPHL